MSVVLDLAKIERMRVAARVTGLGPPLVVNRQSVERVPDILSCTYSSSEDLFRVVYRDLTRASIGRSELPDTEGRSVLAWSVDEFRRGVEVALDDDTVTSFSAEYPRYLRDAVYRKAVDARYGGESEDLGRRVAKRVKETRVKKGWSVAELARRSGIAAPNVHRIESGKHVPSTATLVKLSTALAVPLARLLKV